jgi:hypothetical protein
MNQKKSALPVAPCTFTTKNFYLAPSGDKIVCGKVHRAVMSELIGTAIN